MPPKSRSRKRSRAGGAPPPSPPSQVAAPPASVSADPAFDFLAIIPSPVTLPSSQQARSGAALSAAPLPQTQAALPPSDAASSDLYAFMANIPSPVTLPSPSQSRPSGTATLSVPPISAVSAASHPTQPATHQVPKAAGDAAFDFLASIPSPVTLPPAQGSQRADATISTDMSMFNALERITVSDSPSNASDALNLSGLASVISLPETGASDASEQRSSTAELLARELSHAPSATQLSAEQVPLRLEDRLREAQERIDKELDDLAILRRHINTFSDHLLEHILVLRNLRNNYLRW